MFNCATTGIECVGSFSSCETEFKTNIDSVSTAQIELVYYHNQVRKQLQIDTVEGQKIVIPNVFNENADVEFTFKSEDYPFVYKMKIR